jgi:hypothetical protein
MDNAKAQAAADAVNDIESRTWVAKLQDALGTIAGSGVGFLAGFLAKTGIDEHEKKKKKKKPAAEQEDDG